jgi:hypothetical protein
MIHCLHILSLCVSLSLSLTSQIIFVLSTVEWIDSSSSPPLVARVKSETQTLDMSVDGNSFMNVVGC